MQSFDQSLMMWYTKGVISYENALFYATNPERVRAARPGRGRLERHDVGRVPAGRERLGAGFRVSGSGFRNQARGPVAERRDWPLGLW